VTGGAVSPPIDATVQLVGKKRALRRLQDALEYIDQRDAQADSGSARG
jgi:glutamyl-tRNA synthetase